MLLEGVWGAGGAPALLPALTGQDIFGEGGHRSDFAESVNEYSTLFSTNYLERSLSFPGYGAKVSEHNASFSGHLENTGSSQSVPPAYGATHRGTFESYGDISVDSSVLEMPSDSVREPLNQFSNYFQILSPSVFRRSPSEQSVMLTESSVRDASPSEYSTNVDVSPAYRSPSEHRLTPVDVTSSPCDYGRMSTPLSTGPARREASPCDYEVSTRAASVETMASSRCSVDSSRHSEPAAGPSGAGSSRAQSPRAGSSRAHSPRAGSSRAGEGPVEEEEKVDESESSDEEEDDEEENGEKVMLPTGKVIFYCTYKVKFKLEVLWCVFSITY